MMFSILFLFVVVIHHVDRFHSSFLSFRRYSDLISSPFLRRSISPICNLISMDILPSSFIDSFEFIESEGHFQPSDDVEQNEEIENLLLQHTNLNPSISSTSLTTTRSIDLPSHRKHYGLLTFLNTRIPILFRLANHLYVPYIRFSFALNVLSQHQSNRMNPIFDMISNLPILDMTPIETFYYDRLIQNFSSQFNLTIDDNHRDYSKKILSVALLDCLLGILDCSTTFFQDENHFDLSQWGNILEKMRKEVKSRWTIEEKDVLGQVEKSSRQTSRDESLCISSTSIAQKRRLFERRLNLSLIEQVAGFVQIDSFIFPYIKYSNEMIIYLHINDIRHRYHQYLLLPPSSICRFQSDSRVSHAYHLISEQARENFFWNSIHGSVFMSKCLPNPKDDEFELKFLSLDVLLQAKGLCFVQLFEKVSLEYITSHYQNQFARQFIIGDSSRQGGLINQEIPYLRLGHVNCSTRRIWIPTETKTSRLLTQDERLFINCFLLYHGYAKMILNRDERWYLEELDVDLISSTMDLFDKEYYEQKQRKLFVNC